MAVVKFIPDNGEVISKKVRRVTKVKIDFLRRGWIRIAVRMAIRDRNPI